jgi:hypothetical protein
MSPSGMLKPDPIPPIPVETARVIKMILPRGNAITRLRDEFGTIYSNADFAKLYAKLGQPAIAPWRLALVTVFQFLENLTDRLRSGATWPNGPGSPARCGPSGADQTRLEVRTSSRRTGEHPVQPRDH